MKQLSQQNLTEQQFAQLIGRARLYNYLPKEEKSKIPEIWLQYWLWLPFYLVLFRYFLQLLCQKGFESHQMEPKSLLHLVLRYHENR